MARCAAPIEKAFSKIKEGLCRVEARTEDALVETIGAAGVVEPFAGAKAVAQVRSGFRFA